MSTQPDAVALAARARAGEDYKISFEPCARRIKARWNGMTLADSRRTIILFETRLEPVFYFPRDDVRMDLLIPTPLHTHCPFRGNASYWSIRGGDHDIENAAWSYESPYQEAARLTGYMAFYSNLVEIVDQEIGAAPESDFEPPVDAGNPLVPWLLRDAADLGDPAELVHGLARQMGAANIPVARLWLFLRTLHPESVSTRYGWQRGQDEIDIFAAPHEIVETDAFIRSPLYPIFEGAGGVRRRLDIAEPMLDFPILEDLHADGMTDYVAMPLVLSDGRISALTLAADHPGGFSTESLGYLYEILPVFSRLIEVHAQRQNAINLLDTYLGRHTGRRVLDGLIKRGDGEQIHAVIWFCDLRDSTPLAESMSQQDFLALLNQFFECMAGAVLDHGGEVLRFIGDAVLAIFPIGHPDQRREEGCDRTRAACQHALAAAMDAQRRSEEANAIRRASGAPPVGWGVGLHLGDVTYGNIGTPSRLEFTVIGSAANEAARIESLCKSLGHSVLISESFARHCTQPLRSLGIQRLKGVDQALELFTLPEQPPENPTGPLELIPNP